MIATVLLVTLPGFGLGAIVMALASRRVSREVARGRWIKLAVFFLIVHVVLVLAALGREWIAGLVLLVLAIGAGEVGRAWSRIARPRPLRVWPVFLAVAALALSAAWRLPPGGFVFLFLVAAACDGFSQVVGQWLGRRPLAPRLSPGKTVAGLAGGLAAAAVVAMLLRDLVPASTAMAATVGVATGLAGLAGDLSASWLKRRAGIKDFSSALPGQGGFLDRFDSLLGALAIVGTALVMRA
jgi:phosphatidate cytidylyltransferase